MPPRCLLVDDSQAFQQAARVLLEREGLTVVGAASTIAGALRQARALRPDLILVDIGLGDESGFDLARLLAKDPQAAADVILISTAAEADYRDLAEDSPAAGPQRREPDAGYRPFLICLFRYAKGEDRWPVTAIHNEEQVRSSAEQTRHQEY